MKRNTHFYYAAWTGLLLAALPLRLWAQETNLLDTPPPAEMQGEVGALPGESTETDMVMETMLEDSMPAEPAEAEIGELDTMPAAMPDVEATPEGMPSSMDVPSISLNEADNVQGLQIEQTPEAGPEKISITLDDVRLADVVRIFAQTSGSNIIIPEGLDQRVSANLHDVGWQEALEVILEDKQYVLIEKRPGIYTIMHVNDLKAAPLSVETLNLKYITVENALPAVQGMLVSSNARVTPLPAANVLIVSETPKQIVEIKKILELVDQPRRQVFIEAKFVELNDQAIQDLGINWQVLQGYTVRASSLQLDYTRTTYRTDQDAEALISGRTEFDSSISSSGNASGSIGNTVQSSSTDLFNPANNSGVITSVNNDNTQNTRSTTRGSSRNRTLANVLVQGRNFDSFNADDGTVQTLPVNEEQTVRSAILSADDFALTLSALKQLDGVRIVSNPKILVANGEESTIHVGTKEPITRRESSGEGSAASTDFILDRYEQIGVKLTVKPTINTERNISVNIRPELSRKLGDKVFGDSSYPIISTREISTEFAVESGKTVAIGGLTQGSDNQVVKKVPVLGDIPVIGKFLFTHTHTEETQDEVIIFVSVDMAHVDSLNASQGIPQHGKLIQAWLQQNAGGSNQVRDKSIDEILNEINLGDE